MYSISIPVIISYYKLSGLKQHKSISQFCRSEVQVQCVSVLLASFHKSKIKASAGLQFFLGMKILPNTQASGGTQFHVVAGVSSHLLAGFWLEVIPSFQKPLLEAPSSIFRVSSNRSGPSYIMIALPSTSVSSLLLSLLSDPSLRNFSAFRGSVINLSPLLSKI